MSDIKKENEATSLSAWLEAKGVKNLGEAGFDNHPEIRILDAVEVKEGPLGGWIIYRPRGEKKLRFLELSAKEAGEARKEQVTWDAYVRRDETWVEQGGSSKGLLDMTVRQIVELARKEGLLGE